MPTHKAKDLDPKSRSKKVKGGGLGQDVEHVDRDVARIKKGVQKTVRGAARGVRAIPK